VATELLLVGVYEGDRDGFTFGGPPGAALWGTACEHRVVVAARKHKFRHKLLLAIYVCYFVDASWSLEASLRRTITRARHRPRVGRASMAVIGHAGLDQMPDMPAGLVTLTAVMAKLVGLGLRTEQACRRNEVCAGCEGRRG